MKNQPSIDPRERRAMLDSQYAKFSRVEDLTSHIDSVRDLIAQMSLLDNNGSKKDKASHYSSKISKLEARLKESQESKKTSTLITEEELKSRASSEGIDVSKICVLSPRRAESAPPSVQAQSALVRCDLILRSDCSAVYLDGGMGIDSVMLTNRFLKGEANPDNLPWDEWVKTVTQLPEQE